MTDDDDKQHETEKKDKSTPPPPQVVQPFEGVTELCESLLMKAKFSNTWEQKHDYALSFLESAATLLSEVGAESEAEDLWQFLGEYQRPRIRVYPLGEGTTMKLEELGVRVLGGSSEVDRSQLIIIYEKLSEKLYADSYTQKIAKVVSETMGLLLRHGILRKSAQKLTTAGFFTVPEEHPND